MKVFITGASGFIGGAIAKKLREQHEVIALARSNSSAQKVASLGATPHKCDLLKIEPKHLAGFDVVVHCAAFTEEWGSERDFYDTNVLGTIQILDAAKAAGVKRFIFIGTEAAFFDGSDLVNIDESISYPSYTPYLYSRTKGEAEKRVLAANDSNFRSISIRPRLVWGPGDQSVLPILIEMVEKNRFVWIDNGKYRTSTTHIDNLVHAIEQALVFGDGGEAYFVADDGTISMKEFLSTALAAQGVEAPQRSIPKFIARSLARVVEGFWLLACLKGKPPLVRLPIDMMSAHCTLDTTKAKRDLKYTPPISREDGLQRLAK